MINQIFTFGEIIEASFLVDGETNSPIWMRGIYKFPSGDKHFVSFDADAPDRLVSQISKVNMITVIKSTSDHKTIMIINNQASLQDIKRIVGNSVVPFDPDHCYDNNSKYCFLYENYSKFSVYNHSCE